jgi:hypothetical protein
VRYFVRPRQAETVAYYDDYVPLLPNLSVSDHTATDTGLVDANGNPIMRSPRPIGFGRDSEW